MFKERTACLVYKALKVPSFKRLLKHTSVSKSKVSTRDSAHIETIHYIVNNYFKYSEQKKLCGEKERRRGRLVYICLLCLICESNNQLIVI